MEDELRRRWASIVDRCDADATAASALLDDILLRYREPQRHHHTVEHVYDVTAALDVVQSPDTLLPAVVLAAFLHDVVYDPRRHDNEAASATYAASRLPLAGIAPEVTTEVARLIELTATHETADGDASGIALLDADLSILGSSPERYDRYACAVRAEYGHVEDDAYRAGRRAILQDLVARPRLFRSLVAHERWDTAARANLHREIQSLSHGTGVH